MYLTEEYKWDNKGSPRRVKLYVDVWLGCLHGALEIAVTVR